MQTIHETNIGEADTRQRSRRQAKQLIFAAAFLSYLLSISLFFSGDTDRGIFGGLWVPSILSAGNLLMVGGSK